MQTLKHYQSVFNKRCNPAIVKQQWQQKAPTQLFFNSSETAFGQATVLFLGNDIYAFSLKSAQKTLADYQKKWPNCHFLASDKLCPQVLLQQQNISLCCVGSAFQISVWQQLLAMNTQGLISYQDIAKAIGKPKAVRAVANAVGANPIAIFIPCHRVIYSNGSLGGYHYGPELKQQILQAELKQMSH